MSYLCKANVVFIVIEDFLDLLNTLDVAYVLQYFCTDTHAFRVNFGRFFITTLRHSCGNKIEEYLFCMVYTFG